MAFPPDDAGDDLGSLFDDDDDEDEGFDGTLLDNSIFSGPEIPSYPTLATFGNYQILGGTGNNAYALLGNGNLNAGGNHSGSISLVTSGGSIELAMCWHSIV